jgi:hypothetical protein
VSHAVAIAIGAVLGVAVGSMGLVLVGLVLIRSQEAFDRAELRRNGCRREAGRAGCPCKKSGPAEPDPDALIRVFRETGWIDTETARRTTR